MISTPARIPPTPPSAERTSDLIVEGQPREVSGGVALAVYRIVQEALTNVSHGYQVHARIPLDPGGA